MAKDRKPKGDFYDNPAYWQMVKRNNESIFGAVERRERAKKRMLLLSVGLIVGALAVVGYFFGPL
jgi:uncharacterized oligopeptide transporter (OPT) family protein